MREKVIEAFDLIAEGATAKAACQAVGLSWSGFHRTMNREPSLWRDYLSIQKIKADLLADEVQRLLADSTVDPKRLRAQVDGYLRLIALLDRDRFGDRVQLDVKHLSIRAALEGIDDRLRSRRDLAAPIDAQYTEVSTFPSPSAPDKQSVTAPGSSIFDD